MSPAELLALGRLGRRGARREWRRTSLIAALVAVPVAAALVVAGIVRANDVPPEERAAATFGTAEVKIETWTGSGSRKQIDVETWVDTALAELEPEAEALSYRHHWADVLGHVVDLDTTHPIAAGILSSWEGRLPAAAGEIAVSPRVLRRLDVAVGDVVAFEGRRLRVVGTVVDTVQYNREIAVVTPVGFDELSAAAVPSDPGERGIVWLVSGVDDPEAFAQQLQRKWQQDLPSLLPEPAVTPRPPGLEPLHPTIYAALDPEQIERLAAASVTMTPDELHQAAGELVAEDEVVTAVDPYAMTRDEFLGHGSPGVADRLMTPGVVATLVAAVLLAEVALVAGAAYATGTRRRLRELGLLGATGATVAHIRVAVLGEAALTGLIGGMLGVGLGSAVWTLASPLIQLTVDRYLTGMPLTVGAVMGPVVTGIGAVVLAAWIPARTAARVPTMTALQGRMPLSAPPRWLVPAGLALTGFGGLLTSVALAASGSTAASLMAVAGVLGAIVGMALLTPPIIAKIGGSADRLPATLRLVVRDSARQRTRAAAATAAAMVLLMAPVLIGFGSATDEAQQLVRGLPQPDDHVLLGPAGWDGVGFGPDGAEEEQNARLERVRELLGGATATPVPVVDLAAVPATAPDPGRLFASEYHDADAPPWELRTAIATPEVTAALGEPAIETSIAAGVPVVLGIGSRDTTVTLADGTELEARELPVRVLYGFPRLLLPESVANDLGLSSSGELTLFTGVSLTTDLHESLWDAVSGGYLAIGHPSVSPEATRWIALGATLLVVLIVLALVTALSATESDHDLRTMVAVGAAPRIRRRFLGLQTGYHAFIGAVLAVPLGAGLFWASTRGDAWPNVGPFGMRMTDQMAVPWLVIALVVLVVPAIIAAFTAGTFRSAATVPPRRIG